MTSRIREAAEEYGFAAWKNISADARDVTRSMDEFQAGAEWAIADVLKDLRSESEKLGITDERRLHSEAIAHWIESRFKGE